MATCASLILKNNENVTFVLNPSITYFKSVYRKYTKFSISYKEESPTGRSSFDVDGDNEIKIDFDYYADLLCDISLKVTFSQSSDILQVLPPDLSLHLIQYITFNLSGKQNPELDKLDKEYINFNAMLNNPKSLNSTYTIDQDKTLTCNNGNNFQNMALCGGVMNAVTEPKVMKKMNAVIPLPFAFSKSIGTAIPLCTLNQTTVKPQIVLTRINVQDENKFSTVSDDNALITKSFKYSAVAKYIFLSDEERFRFINTRLEYLYERVNNLNEGGSSWSKINGTTINISSLNHKHPIKQIFIYNAAALDQSYNKLKYNISVNGQGIFSESFNHEFFSKVEIVNKFKGCIYGTSLDASKNTILDNNIALIDFSLKNTEGPSGCISPSNNTIKLHIDNNNSFEFNIKIYTVCYYLLSISNGELRYVFD